MKKRILFLLSLVAITLTATAQTIKNASFESGLTGWDIQNLKTQTNSVFSIKSGTTYVEKWVDKGRAVGDARAAQTIQNVPVGCYTLTVAAQNIQEDTPNTTQSGTWIFAGDKKTNVGVRAQYTVQFTCITGEVTVGFEAVGATGNWIALDNFRLTKRELDMEAVRNEILALITATEVYTQQDMDAESMQNLKQVISNARQLTADNGPQTTDGVLEEAKALVQAQSDAQTAIYQYKKDHATVDNPLDMTEYIVNPSFEDNWTGWTQVGMQLQSNTAFTVKEGNTYAEKWVAAGGKVGDGSILQRIKGLDPGTYLLKAAGQNIQENATGTKQTGAWLVGASSQTAIQARGEYSLQFVSIDGETEIGFLAEGATGNWLAVDNFRLYYAGSSVDVLTTELQQRITSAESLLEKKMQAACRTELQQCIDKAQGLVASQPQDIKSNITTITDALMLSIRQAGNSIEAYEQLRLAIADAEKTYGAGTGNNADVYRVAIDKAIYVNDDLNSSNEALAAQVKALVDAKLIYKMDNASGSVPKVTTDPRTVHACQEVFGRMSVSGVLASQILEQGFVYSETNPEPTVLDERSTDYLDHNGYIYRMPMKAGTLYYIRAYAMTKNYQVGYGDVIRVSTLPQGSVTWSYDYASDDPAQNNRIETALKDASGWWTDYTSIRGFKIDGHWSPGTPTADCGYGGYCRIGTNMGQRCGTLLHEMNHGVGCGTLEIWGGWVESPLRVTMNGDWAGDRARNAIGFWENDDTVVPTGAYDGAHWAIHHIGQAYEEGGGATALWMNKYAINGAHLEPGAWAGPTNWNDTQVLFIGNSIVTQGYMEDGLIPVNAWSGGQCLPTYTFEHRDNQKYYLTNESDTRGRFNSYLTETATGTLKWMVANTEDAELDTDADGMDDRAAWYVTFNAQTQLYQFQNAATGHYLSNTTGTTMKAVSKTTTGATENFTLMQRRKVDAGTDSNRGFWITNFTSRNSLQAGAAGSVSSATQDLWDAARQQRWMILTATEAYDKSVGEKLQAESMLADLVKNLRVIEKHPAVENVEDADSHSLFDEALANAENYLQAEKSAQELNDMYDVTRQAGMDYIGSVTPVEKPFDLSFFITNPTMKENTEGWSDAPTHNYGCSEFFMKTFDCNQTVVGMPKGYYVATVQGFQRPGTPKDTYLDFINGTATTSAYLYLSTRTAKLAHIGSEAQGKQLGGNESAVGTPTVYIPNDMKAASIYFDNGLYENEVVLNQISKKKDLKLGVRCTASNMADATWTIFRNFHLYYYGATDPTGIESPAADMRNSSTGIYDLSGRKLTTPMKKGIYIVNGKKIIK